jgi:hypothetical protein
VTICILDVFPCEMCFSQNNFHLTTVLNMWKICGMGEWSLPFLSLASQNYDNHGCGNWKLPIWAKEGNSWLWYSILIEPLSYTMLTSSHDNLKKFYSQSDQASQTSWLNSQRRRREASRDTDTSYTRRRSSRSDTNTVKLLITSWCFTGINVCTENNQINVMLIDFSTACLSEHHISFLNW